MTSPEPATGLLEDTPIVPGNDTPRCDHHRPAVHGQPQSLCPAFGSLRTGLRMRRTAVVLVGSACCVYGLTFISHFYGARRSVGYVPFGSESLVTGRLFEDIRAAVMRLADPARYDTIVVINLCIPAASGVPLHLLPREVSGVRIIGTDIPGFGVPTHAEAKDVLAAAMLAYARAEAERGRVAPPPTRGDKPAVALLGEMFPLDPMTIGALLEPMGLNAGPAVPTRDWRELYGALDCPVAAVLHPFYGLCADQFEMAGRLAVGSAPVGRAATASWLDAIGAAHGLGRAVTDRAKNAILPALKTALADNPVRGRIVLSGYEGSELLVARLLIECGADVPYVGTACPGTLWSDSDRDWLEAEGVAVRFRTTLEQDIDAVDQLSPDLVIGTPALVQHAKSRAIPALYFTNLISARPLMGLPGVASLSGIVNTALAGQARFQRMEDFFAGVGEGPTGGIWPIAPAPHRRGRVRTGCRDVSGIAGEATGC